MPIFSFAAPFFRQWNSARTLEKLPRNIAILMLSGKQDEVVPPEHMRQLWEIAVDTSTPVATSSSATSRSRRIFRWRKSKTLSETKRDVAEPPRSGRFVELPRGAHSKSMSDSICSVIVALFVNQEARANSCFLNAFIDDTWDDPAYWDAVEAFLESLPTESSPQ